MIILVHAAVYLLFVHFFADFICQSDNMALNKSSNNKFLTIHILTYSSVLLLGSLPLLVVFSFASIAGFVAMNAVAHWITDYFTSRLAGKLFKQGKRHEFFVVIGFDQFLHVAALAYSAFAVFQ